LDRKFKEWAGRGNLRQGLQVNDRVVVKTMPDPVPQDYPELALTIHARAMMTASLQPPKKW
jgi:hypothetical protein